MRPEMASLDISWKSPPGEVQANSGKTVPHIL